MLTVKTAGFWPLWKGLHDGQVRSVTNVGFAAACRPHIRCNGGDVAIGSVLSTPDDARTPALKGYSGAPRFHARAQGAPNRQRCAAPCRRLNSAYSPHIVTSVKQGNSAACCASCHTPAQCKNGAASMPPRDSGDADQLLVDEFLDAGTRQFSAVTRILHAAERQFRR